MLSLIFFTLILVTIAYYIHKYNKIPKGLENIQDTSTLPTFWAILRNKTHDEIEETILRSAKGHNIYLNRLAMFNVVINDPELVKDLSSRTEDEAPKAEYPFGGVVREFFGDSMLFSNGDKWRTSKRLATIGFNNSLSPKIFEDIVIELYDFMRPTLNEPINVFELMQRTTVEAIGKFAFGYQFGGLKSVELPHIINVYKHLISIVDSLPRTAFPWINDLPIESNRKFSESLKEFDKFIFDIIEEKRKEIKNNSNFQVNVLTSMLELNEQEGIYADSKQLRDEIVSFFVAGHDTTSTAISISLYFLARYPEMQERAREEVIGILGNEPTIIPTSEQLKKMKYLNAIIKETLRMYPPAAIIVPRKLVKPTRIGSHVLPANSRCLVNVWQVHRNPKYWEDPDKYDPERFLNDIKRHPYSWIPFSVSPRNCIGQSFTLMEQRILISMILLKYKWSLPKDSIHKEKLILEPAFLLRPVDIKLVFTERN